jgi:phosphoglycerate dehydrogenase-like enzyme
VVEYDQQPYHQLRRLEYRLATANHVTIVPPMLVANREGRPMPTLMMLPPQNDQTREWAKRLAEMLPGYRVLAPESEEDAANDLPGVDAAYGWVSPEMLPLARNLQWLQSPQAAPPPWFYYQELIDHPVTVTNMRGIYNDHIAQHIMMYVLALGRGLPYYMDAQRERRWDQDAAEGPYIDLTTATALIVGIGGIGQETARLCNAFGMRVIGVDARWEWNVQGIEKHAPEDLDDLLPEADFVIVTLPHTPETEGMWNAARFRGMKSTGFFINIGRGMTTKLDDLVLALERGEIAGCGLDVFEIEPLPADHKLWRLSNVILTPHIAVKDATNVEERRFEVLIDNARRFAAGEPVRNVVDKARWY